MPMRDFISSIVPALAEINMLANDVTPGKESSVFGATSDENAIKVGTLICFDAIYETLAIESARSGAEIFIVPSNDSWFYDSRAMNMHHSQNILRAVEQGKYTVNCGNTGITSVVNDKGEVLSIMPIYEEGYVIDTVYASSTRTLYSYIGNLYVYLCVAFAFAPFVVNIWYKKKVK
jgi:apolipoprotein N-acyltransferase